MAIFIIYLIQFVDFVELNVGEGDVGVAGIGTRCQTRGGKRSDTLEGLAQGPRRNAVRETWVKV